MSEQSSARSVSLRPASERTSASNALALLHPRTLLYVFTSAKAAKAKQCTPSPNEQFSEGVQNAAQELPTEPCSNRDRVGSKSGVAANFPQYLACIPTHVAYALAVVRRHNWLCEQPRTRSHVPMWSREIKTPARRRSTRERERAWNEPDTLQFCSHSKNRSFFRSQIPRPL